MVAGPPDSYLLDEAQRAGCEVVAIDFGSRRGSLMPGLALGKELRARAPALIHVHGARVALPVVLRGTWLHMPMIYTVHGLHFHHKADAESRP
jgi:hypothetical protein